MKRKMMKVFDTLATLLIVAVRNYTMATIIECVQLAHWLIRIVLVGVVKLVIMYSRQPRARVKMSMCSDWLELFLLLLLSW